jgi:protein SCO1
MTSDKHGGASMGHRFLSFGLLACLFFCVPLFAASSGDANTLPQELAKVGVTERIGNHLPFDAVLINAQGEKAFLGDYFKNGRPKILIFAYYTCPMLCGLVLDGAARAVAAVPGLGTDYDVMTISMNPLDTVVNASAFEIKYNKEALGTHNVPEGTPNPWRFFVGNEGSERTIADAAGFGYSLESNGEYAHASLIMLVSADGKMTRYLYGIEHLPFDLKLAVAEAKLGKGVSSVERVLLFCYNYDPDARGYVLFAVRLMRIGGLVTVFLLVGLVIWLTLTSKGRKA